MGFKTVFSTNREALKSNESQHSIIERVRVKKAQKRSITSERDILLDLMCDIKTVTLNRPTTDSTIVLKTGYRQADTQTDGQPKYIFTV